MTVTARRRLRPEVKAVSTAPDEAPPVDGLEHKAIHAVGALVADEDQGIAVIFPSVTGIVDEVSDVIEPGAYEDTLKVRWPRGLSGHDWERRVAKALDAKELLPGDPDLPKQKPDGTPWPAEAGALMVTAQYNLRTQLGRDTWENIKFFGADQEFSVGYKVPKGASTLKGKIRHIKAMDLYEFSDVLWGAMPLARTSSLKAHPVSAPPAREGKYLYGSDIPGSAEWVRERFQSGGVAGFPRRRVVATFPGHVLLGEDMTEEITNWDNQYMQVSYVIEGDQVVVTDSADVDITTTVTPKVPSHLADYDAMTDGPVDLAAEYAAMAALRDAM